MSWRTLALALVVVVAAGCGERSEPLGPAPPPYPVAVAGAGDRSTVVTARPQSIVALDPGSAELLLALGAGDRLVGVPAAPALEVPGAARVARPSGAVDVEVVVRLAPDLLVATADTDRVDLARVERATGAAVYLQPAASAGDVAGAVVELGLLVGEPLRGRRLALAIRRRVAETEARLAGVAPVTVFVDAGFLLTVPARSLVGDLVRRARAELVPGRHRPAAPFAPCEVARLEPDVYLLLAEPGWRRPPSFRHCDRGRVGRVVVLPAALVARPGARVPQALAALARALHPDAFSG